MGNQSNRRRLPRRSTVAAAAGLLVLAAPCAEVMAGPTLQTRTTELRFDADKVSLWGTGDAVALSGSKSFGFDKSGSISGLSKLGVNMSGNAGAHLTLDYRATSGHADIAYGASLTTLIPTSAAPGSLVTLSSSYTPTFGSLQTYSPQVSARLAADAYAGMELSVFGKRVANPKFDKSWTLFDFDTDKGTKSWDYRFGRLDLSVPEVNTVGSLGSDGRIRSSGEDSFLALSTDIDAFITAATGIPFGVSGKVDLGLLRGSYSADLLDLDFNFGMGVKQQFEFDGQVMARYALEDGSSVVAGAGQAVDFKIPDGDWGDSFDVDVVYFLESELRNNTDLTADARFDLEMFEASGEVSAKVPKCTFKKWKLRCGLDWTRIFSGHMGPLVDGTWDVLDGNIGVFDRRFEVEGFNTVQAHYAIALDRDADLDRHVPEPATTALLGASLLILGAQRRRCGRAWLAATAPLA